MKIEGDKNDDFTVEDFSEGFIGGKSVHHEKDFKESEIDDEYVNEDDEENQVDGLSENENEEDEEEKIAILRECFIPYDGSNTIGLTLLFQFFESNLIYTEY
jgi:hypothetical protein